MFCIGNKECVDWLEEDGGSLDLFGCQPGAIAPAEVVTRIFPRRNNFLFFEVTNRSFHQVKQEMVAWLCVMSYLRFVNRCRKF